MLAYLFLILAAGLRFLALPTPLAFTMGPALLFFGARRPRREIWAAVGLLAAADVLLTMGVYGYPFSADHLVTWAWYAAIPLLGGLLRSDARPLKLASTSLASSFSFYLVSNLAVWAVWNMYPKTLDGLLASYVAAVPFFRYTPVTDLVLTAAMFSAPALAGALSRRFEGERRMAA